MAFDPDSSQTFTSVDSDNDPYRDESDANVSTESADTSDEVQVSKLVDEVSINDIRWVYRNTFAKKIVDKPVEDAFKHGFEIKNEPTKSIGPLLEKTGWVDTYKRTQKKARRDGFALLYIITEDDAEGPWIDPNRSDVNVTDVIRTKTLTIDDLTDAAPTDLLDQINANLSGDEQFDNKEIEVRKRGIVVNRRHGDPDFGDPIGYVLDRTRDFGGQTKNVFVHRNRVQHLVWNDEVDVEFKGTRENGERYLGRWEGDSIIQPSYHYIKDSFKGTWAIMQTLFRYSSPLYELKLPARVKDEDEVEEIREEWRHMNAAAEAVLPPDYELDLHTTDGALEPEGYFDPIFEQICASNEMTKSVLFGTQSGTVSGSETDVKNYFNQVERFRRTDVEDDLDDYVRRVMRWNRSLVPTFAFSYDIKWPELFRLNELDKAEKWNRVMNTLNQAANQFFITPNEGRELLAEMLEEDFDTDLEGELDAEDFELLEELQMAQVGAETAEEKAETTGNPRVGQNGGGMEQGQKTGEVANRSDSEDEYTINW